MLNLTEKSIDLLKRCLDNDKKELLWVIDRKEFIAIDESLGNELREAILDELIINGFDGDKPTEYG